MSLDKSIAQGKEHRKPYRGSKAIDCTCRNHGSCEWCRQNRQHKFRDKHPIEKGEIQLRDERNCAVCIWMGKDGECTQWDCDYISRAEARLMVDAMRKEKSREN